MNARGLLNLGLLLLIALLAWLAIDEPGLHSKPPVAMPLTGLKAAEVDRIRIERPDQPPITLRRKTDQWWMETPAPVAANTTRVDALLRLAAIRPATRFPAEPAALARYGLDGPAVTVTFNDRVALRFGATAALDRRRYVQVGDSITLVDEVDYYQAAGDPGGFVDSRLLPEGAVIERLLLPGITLSRAGQSWRITPSAPTDSGDLPAILINNWLHARAFQVKFTPPQGGESVQIFLKGAESPVSFRVAHTGDELWLYRADLGLGYRLPGELADRLLRLPSTTTPVTR